jgi:hypothetical protein
MTNLTFTRDLLIRLCVGLFAAYVGYQLLLGKHVDFVIRLRRGRVDYQGKFPLSQQSAFTQLLLHDLSLKDSIKIMGCREGRRTRIWFRGKLGEAEKQRIRNFLMIGS